jgi:hypothetical protein
MKFQKKIKSREKRTDTILYYACRKKNALVLLARLQDGVEESKRQMILVATGGYNIHDSLVADLPPHPMREEVVAIARRMKCSTTKLGNPL